MSSSASQPSESQSMASSRSGTSIPDDLRREVEEIAEASGCELVHMAFAGQQLRIFIDRPEGVTIKDCEIVSKQVSALLDVYDYGRRRYVLEVSSPGLDRELYGPRDYERFAGKLVRVTFLDGPERKKRTVIGRLERFDSHPSAPDRGSIHVAPEDSPAIDIPLDRIQVARLEIEL